MSTSTPSSDKRESVADDLPPDPLLASGSFISSTTTAAAGDGALENSAKRRPIQGGFGSGGSNMSNSTDQVHPSPDNSAHPAESKSRKRAAPGDNWLPPGWRVEDKVRTSGATAGSVDKYYHEPITGRKFRSRTEVLYYLEHGTSKKSSKNFHSEHFEGQGSSSKASRKAKEPPVPPLNFDFENAPEKVTWAMMTNGGEEAAWTPFVGDEKVQDTVRRDWSNAFTVITTKNPSKLS